MINSKETGVYKIINLINNKIYVGSSSSTKDGFKDRIRTHIRLLNSKTHPNKHLQSAWDKYGSHNFSFQIIEVIEDKNKIIEREQFWIDFYCVTNPDIGYNLSPTANSQLGFRHSEESKKKMSESAKKYSKEISERMKKLNTGKKMSDEQKTKISKKIKGLKRSDEFKNKMSIIRKTNPMKQTSIEKMRLTKIGSVSKKRKPVYQLDLDGNVIKLWAHAGDAERELIITKGKISAVCLGKRKTAGGFKWRYYNEMV